MEFTVCCQDVEPRDGPGGSGRIGGQTQIGSAIRRMNAVQRQRLGVHSVLHPHLGCVFIFHHCRNESINQEIHQLGWNRLKLTLKLAGGDDDGRVGMNPTGSAIRPDDSTQPLHLQLPVRKRFRIRVVDCDTAVHPRRSPDGFAHIGRRRIVDSADSAHSTSLRIRTRHRDSSGQNVYPELDSRLAIHHAGVIAPVDRPDSIQQEVIPDASAGIHFLCRIGQFTIVLMKNSNQ